jgi:hypothetical protein
VTPQPRARQSWRAEVRLNAMIAAEVFRVSGWTWGGVFRSDARTPTVDEIEEALWDLIGNLEDNQDVELGWSSSRGRLRVEMGDEGDLHISIALGTLEHFFAEKAA